MTVDTEVKKTSALGNGAATIFSFDPIVIFNSTDLLVVTTVIATGVETVRTEGTGANNWSLGITTFPATGSITYPADQIIPLPSTERITIKRVLPLTQLTDLQNQGGYFADTQETAFDKGIMISLQQEEEIGRSLKIPVSDTVALTALPGVAGRTSKILGFDTLGQPVAVENNASGSAVTALGSTTSILLSERFSYFPNVKNHGALGDGVADDTAAFQATIDSITDGDDVIIEVPKPTATYKLDSALVLGTRQVTWFETEGVAYSGTSGLAGLGGTRFFGTKSTSTGTDTARLLADHLADFLSVKDFGAVGDGIHDDTTKIQAAIDANPGGLYFPPGIYIVSSALLVADTTDCRRFFGPVAVGRGNQSDQVLVAQVAGDTAGNYAMKIEQAGVTIHTLNFAHKQLAIDYDAQTVNFTAGQVLTGATSGATCTILSDTDAGATGTLLVKNIVGTFVNNEIITDALTGSATLAERASVAVTLEDREDPETLIFAKRSASAEDVDLTVIGCEFNDFTSAINVIGRGCNIFECIFQSGNVGIELEFDFTQVGVDLVELGQGPDDAWRSTWIRDNRFHSIDQTCISNLGTNHQLINGLQILDNHTDQNCNHFFQGSARHALFNGNFLLGCSGFPFFFQADTTGRIRNVDIVGNFIQGWHTAGALPGFGSHTLAAGIADRSDLGIFVDADVDVLNIAGNMFGYFNQGAIKFTDQVAQNVNINNNTFKEINLERTLTYGTQTGNFTVGLTITGGTSGATAVIVEDQDDGATGTLVLKAISATQFQNGEIITDTSTGSATTTALVVTSPVIDTATGGSMTNVSICHNNIQWESPSDFFIGASASIANETVFGNVFNVQPVIGIGPSGMQFSFVDSSGNMLFNKTTNGNENAGAVITQDGQIITTRDGNAGLNVNRLTSDGTLVFFLQDSVVEGSISVAGTTVSYNAFMGAHYTEMTESTPPLGSIMEVAPGMVVRRHARQNRLPRCKLSNTVASKAVYGVYLREDDDEEADNPNPGGGIKGHYVAALGAGWVRVAPGSVAIGDLIESAGNGIGRVQADDIIRSSTVGKIISLTPKNTEPGGVRLLPCVLMCG